MVELCLKFLVFLMVNLKERSCEENLKVEGKSEYKRERIIKDFKRDLNCLVVMSM